MNEVSAVSAAATKLRNTITDALQEFAADTDNYYRPDVQVGWRDVTEYKDDRQMFVPVVSISVKVYV